MAFTPDDVTNHVLLQRERTMETVQNMLNASLYDFISGKCDVDLKALESFCADNLSSLDFNIIHQSQQRLNMLYFCLRRIYVQSMTRRKVRDPYEPASSASPNACNLS